MFVPEFFLFISDAAASSANPWIATVGAIVIAVITGLVSWRTSKSKTKNDQFVALMEQSAEFREELRKDRDIIKTELASAKKDLEAMRVQLSDCEIKMVECQKKLETCQEHTHEVLQQLKRNR
jgi:hypothetical protein